MKDQLLSSGTDQAIDNQTIDHNQPANTYKGPISIGHPVEIFLFPIRLRTAESANGIEGAPFKPDVGLSGDSDDDAPIDLCAAADPGRMKPRRGLGGPHRRHKFVCKRLGEIAEAKFLAKAADLGFTVNKPWGDSELYDFILDPHRGSKGLKQVQVKSAHRKMKGKGYLISTHDISMHCYRPHDVDFLVAYVLPEDVWYVMPIRVVQRNYAIELYPSGRWGRSKYEKYREAWWRLEK